MDKFVRVGKPGIKHGAHTLQAGKGDVGMLRTASLPRVLEWGHIMNGQLDVIDIELLSKSHIEQLLRVFDIHPAYGPFIGISRQARWERAQRCYLKPPTVIKRLLTRACCDYDEKASDSLW